MIIPSLREPGSNPLSCAARSVRLTLSPCCRRCRPASSVADCQYTTLNAKSNSSERKLESVTSRSPRLLTASWCIPHSKLTTVGPPQLTTRTSGRADRPTDPSRPRPTPTALRGAGARPTDRPLPRLPTDPHLAHIRVCALLAHIIYPLSSVTGQYLNLFTGITLLLLVFFFTTNIRSYQIVIMDSISQERASHPQPGSPTAGPGAMRAAGALLM